MLLFSTVLDINEKMDREQFLRLIVEWNNTQYYPENTIPDLVLDKKVGEKYGDDRLWMQFEEYKSSIAVHYQKCTDDGIIWDTYYVMNFRNKTLSICLERSYSEDALRMDDQFSAPYIITLLIDKRYLKKDNDLLLLREATIINIDNISLLADVVNGTKHYKYPVVYVSKSFNNEDPVDVTRLAQRLKGLAHVLVQEDVSFNKDIMNACSGKNEYKGEVGIYFPNTKVGHKVLTYRRAVGQDPMLLDKIVQTVLQYSNSQKIDNLLTWQGINSAVLSDRVKMQSETIERVESSKNHIEQLFNKMKDSLDDQENEIRKKLEADIKSEIDAYIEMAQEDSQRNQAKIDELNREIEQLKIENQGLNYKLSRSDKMPILSFGEENELYEGEIKDLILKTLDESVNKLPTDSRKRDVFIDIIKNNDYQKISINRENLLKNKLKSYDGMSHSTRRLLEDEIGFEIKEGGKHYTGFYYGDQRYVKTFSKTPSDWRSGQKMVSDISAIIY